MTSVLPTSWGRKREVTSVVPTPSLQRRHGVKDHHPSALAQEWNPHPDCNVIGLMSEKMQPVE
jgi:hypothetical protein